MATTKETLKWRLQKTHEKVLFNENYFKLPSVKSARLSFIHV